MTVAGAGLCSYLAEVAAGMMLQLTNLVPIGHERGSTSDSRYGKSHRQRPSATQVTSASRLRTSSTAKMRHSSVIDRYTAASFTLRTGARCEPVRKPLFAVRSSGNSSTVPAITRHHPVSHARMGVA